MINKSRARMAAAGLGVAGIAFIAGCHSQRSSPPAPAAPQVASLPPAAPTPAPATAAQTASFQPYVLVNQPPPIPKATSHRHRALRIASYHHQVYLADCDHHYYNAGRDSAGHLYPVYHDAVTNRSYPLYYDGEHDDYYRMLRTDDGDYYRNYVGTGGNDYYRDQDPPHPEGAGDAYNTASNYNYNNYNPYSPPPACLPQVYDPNGQLYAPQSTYYGDQPAVHHSHGNQDLWLLAIPVVIGAYLLLNQHHHSSSGYSDSPPAGYYASYPNHPAPPPGERPWNPPPGYKTAWNNSYTHDVSTTIINNNNQRITNIYTVSPPPQAIAQQPYQRPMPQPFAHPFSHPIPATFAAATAVRTHAAPVPTPSWHSAASAGRVIPDAVPAPPLPRRPLFAPQPRQTAALLLRQPQHAARVQSPSLAVVHHPTFVPQPRPAFAAALRPISPTPSFVPARSFHSSPAFRSAPPVPRFAASPAPLQRHRQHFAPTFASRLPSNMPHPALNATRPTLAQHVFAHNPAVLQPRQTVVRSFAPRPNLPRMVTTIRPPFAPAQRPHPDEHIVLSRPALPVSPPRITRSAPVHPASPRPNNPPARSQSNFARNNAPQPGGNQPPTRDGSTRH